MVEEARVPGENHRYGQATGKLYYLRLRIESIFFLIYQVGANPRFILLFSFNLLLQSGGAVVAMIVCWLDLQLPM